MRLMSALLLTVPTAPAQRDEASSGRTRCCSDTSTDNHDVVMAWEQFRKKEWRNLDELYAGQYDGMTYEEINAQFPLEF